MTTSLSKRHLVSPSFRPGTAGCRRYSQNNNPPAESRVADGTLMQAPEPIVPPLLEAPKPVMLRQSTCRGIT